jgi:NAD(P)-dependent dehydrogenase (short-subunit alcohol dehydrogenase family)
MNRLNRKVALITGGNSGIGFAIAKAFSAHGASVAMLGRDRATLERARLDLPGPALAKSGDVSSLEDLGRFVADSVDHFGPIDIVVANAGGATIEPFEAVTEDSFDRQTSINFKGAFFTVQKAIPSMRDGGSVILVSSSANCKAVPGMSVYGAAKAAVRSVARTLTVELAPRRIRVNVLTPGPTFTPAYSRTGLPAAKIKAFQTDQKKQIPLGRIADASELANAALFLASDESSFVAGAELVADGGMTQV